MKPATIEAIKALCDNSNPRHADGWAWLDKAMTLARYVETERPECVVELGIFGGRSMLPMALQAKDNGRGVVFGIDPWTHAAALEGEHKKADSDWWAKIDLERIMLRFMGQIINLGLIDVAVPIRATSQAVAGIFPPASIGLLHIDSNHSELASLRDIALYLPKVRPGGIVVLDDLGWETNQAAVKALDSRCETIQDVKSEQGWCRFYRKP
jgi:predicted O-methyltransferase YrrM